jgi:FkbM family methyltransferase
LRRGLGLDLLFARPEITDLLAQQQIDVVLDVGANVGQYALLLRSWGYRGRIISFEPLSAQFQQLKAQADRDPAWEVFNIGLGESEGTATINVAASSVYSSILAATPALHAFDAQSGAVRTETITVRRLDAVLPEVRGSARNLFLKVDTQGYERQVLAGAGDALGSFKGIQLELSEIPMYSGESTFLEMTNLLAARGFRIGLVRPFAHDPRTKLLVQSDVVFVPAEPAALS